MTSLSAVAESLRVEGNLHEAKDPVSAKAKLSTRTAKNEKELGMGVQMGMAGSETEVMLPSDRENGATHMGAENLTNTDQSLLASPVLPAYGQRSR